MKRLADLVTRFMAEVVPPIRDGRLPDANASMDYKASNLIYTEDGPVLVDPDNGDFAPRLLDLAQAALLFHTEHDAVPPRPFDANQWSAFIQAYLRHVSLTEQERALWPLAIKYMLSEEGHWAFTAEPSDWQLPRQNSFLLALAETRRTTSRFPDPALQPILASPQLRQRTRRRHTRGPGSVTMSKPFLHDGLEVRMLIGGRPATGGERITASVVPPAAPVDRRAVCVAGLAGRRRVRPLTVHR